MTLIQPYSWDRIDKAFDFYYDEELDRADIWDWNVRDYDRQMFRRAIEKYIDEETIVKHLVDTAKQFLQTQWLFWEHNMSPVQEYKALCHYLYIDSIWRSEEPEFYKPFWHDLLDNLQNIIEWIKKEHSDWDSETI